METQVQSEREVCRGRPAGLEGEGRRQARNAGSPWKLERARDTDRPLGPLREHSPANTWVWAQETDFRLLTPRI